MQRRRSAARPRGTGRGRRGAAVAELAVVLPVLLSLVLLCIDFGQFAYYYMAVTNAARAGAGYGSANPYTASTQTMWQTATVQAVKNEFAQNAWYNSAKLTVATPVATQQGNGYWTVSVTVTYSFQTLVNWAFFSGYNHPISLTRTVVMRGTI